MISLRVCFFHFVGDLVVHYTINSMRQGIDHDHCAQGTHYDVHIYRITTKSLLSTSFPTTCSSASETIGLLG